MSDQEEGVNPTPTESGPSDPDDRRVGGTLSSGPMNSSTRDDSGVEHNDMLGLPTTTTVTASLNKNDESAPSVEAFGEVPPPVAVGNDAKEAHRLAVSPTHDANVVADGADAAMPPTPLPTVPSPSGRPVSTPTPTTSRPSAETTNVGAQILKNRFLSLKERANQNAQTLWAMNSPALSENAKAVQERAGLLWKTASSTAPTVVAGFRMPPAPPGLFSTMTTTTTPQQQQQPKEKGPDQGPSRSNAHSDPSRPTEPGTELQPRQLSLDDHNDDNDDDDTAVRDDKSKGSNEAATDALKSTAGTPDGDDDTSSMGGASDVASLLLTGRALTRASLVASVAFESSVATFRGRYNAAAAASAATPTSASTPTRSGATTRSEDETVTDSRPLPESQIEIILKSRVGQYMQEILDKLEPHEFAMLLGRGMLGVNLKQCYLKNHGVFIDFMVPGGQAANSGVIRSGDLPVRLGEIDLRKGTILDMPAQISQARRPAVLTLATGSTVSLERLNYVDVAVAMMHRARAYYTKRGTLSNLPSATSPPRGDGSRVSTATPSADSDIKSVSDVTVPPADTIDCFITPPPPTLDIRQDFLEEVPLR